MAMTFGAVNDSFNIIRESSTVKNGKGIKQHRGDGGIYVVERTIIANGNKTKADSV